MLNNVCIRSSKPGRLCKRIFGVDGYKVNSAIWA